MSNINFRFSECKFFSFRVPYQSPWSHPDFQEETGLNVAAMMMRPEEMHIAEEWYHGAIESRVAADRLLNHKQDRQDQGEGLFLVRDSS